MSGRNVIIRNRHFTTVCVFNAQKGNLKDLLLLWLLCLLLRSIGMIAKWLSFRYIDRATYLRMKHQCL